MQLSAYYRDYNVELKLGIELIIITIAEIITIPGQFVTLYTIIANLKMRKIMSRAQV